MVIQSRKFQKLAKELPTRPSVEFCAVVSKPSGESLRARSSDEISNKVQINEQPSLRCER